MMTLTERINELNTLLKQDEFSVRLQERFKNNQVKRGLVLQSAKYNSSPTFIWMMIFGIGRMRKL